MRRAARRVLWFWENFCFCASMGQTKPISMATRNNSVPRKRHDLFKGKYPKEVAVKTITNKQNSFIEHYHPELNAILFPLVVWLGRDIIPEPTELFPKPVEDRELVITDDVRNVFGLSFKKDKLLISFIKHEAGKLYRFDSEGNHKGHMTPYEVTEIIKAGCRILSKKLSNKPIAQIREEFTNDMKRFNVPLVFSKTARYLWNGRDDKLWYPRANYELTRLLPDVKPKILFNILAGTSMNTTLQSNIKLFFRALAQYKHGTKVLVKIPGMNQRVETQFKGIFSGAIYQLWHFFEHGTLTGRKISNFADALDGNVLAVVVDIWMMRIFGVDRKYRAKTLEQKSRSPTKSMYDAIEYYVRLISPILDLEPRQFQAMTWGGVRTEETGGGNDKTYSHFMASHLHWNDMFIGPNKVHTGSDGLHFGVQASKDYKNLIKSGVFTTD